jgi:hypothetical protein
MFSDGLNWEGAAMQVKFDLGRVMIGQDAALALDVSGQDADFFLCKHARGDCGEENPSANDFQLLVVSRYRTLHGQIIEVMTFVREQVTYVHTLPTSISANGFIYDVDCAVCKIGTDTTSVEPPPHLDTLPNSIDINAHIYDGDCAVQTYDSDCALCATSTDTTTTMESLPHLDTLPNSIDINGYIYEADGAVREAYDADCAVPETTADTSTTIESPSDTDMHLSD